MKWRLPVKGNLVRLFPKNAVIERKMFSAERNIRWLCASPVTSSEQSNSTIVFWFCSPVKFFTSILVECKYVQVSALLNSVPCHYKTNVYHLNRSVNKLARCMHISFRSFVIEIRLPFVIPALVAIFLWYIVIKRIPVPHDNYLESIISSRSHCKGYFCLLFSRLHDVDLLTDQWGAILKIDKELRIDWKKIS